MNAKKLSGNEKKILRSKANELEPILRIGKKGLVPPVMEELNKQLGENGLIKVKLLIPRMMHKEIIERIVNNANCDLIDNVGSVIVLYRHGIKPFLSDLVFERY